MAGRLNPSGRPATGRRRRRAAFVALVLAVAVVHGCVTRSVAERLEAFEASTKAPPRIEVAYVRELQPVTPPAAVAAPPPAVPKARPARQAQRPAPAASVPKAEAEVAEASAPAASAVAQADEAASAPDESASAASVASSAGSEPAVAEADASATAAAQVAASTPTVVGAAASQPDLGASDATLASAAAPASAASGAATFEWPVSTKVSYELTGNYRGEVQGQAQVEWVRVGTHYRVHLDIVIGPSFAPLITRRMSSDGELGKDGLAPRRYDQNTKVAFSEPRRAALVFDDASVVLANGNRHERLPGVQDAASQFIQMTYLFSIRPEMLRVGNHFEMPLALPYRLDRWTYDVLDEDTVYTTFGPLPVLHVKPRAGNFRAGDLVPEIWFAPELRYLPVRIRIQQDASANFIDLVIARRPQLAAR